jgi:hypothetical protein
MPGYCSWHSTPKFNRNTNWVLSAGAIKHWISSNIPKVHSLQLKVFKNVEKNHTKSLLHSLGAAKNVLKINNFAYK